MKYFMCVRLEHVAALEWKIQKIDNVSYLELEDCKKRADYYQSLEDKLEPGLWVAFSNNEIENIIKNGSTVTFYGEGEEE